MTDLITELKALKERATPVTGHKLNRYEHGGGRLFIDGDKRNLIADFYGEGPDRELLYALWLHHEAILAKLEEGERMREAALEEAANYVGRVLDYGAESIMQGIRDLKTTQRAKHHDEQT